MSEFSEELILKAKAIESLLIEKEIVDEDTLDLIVEEYEKNIGPHIGAKIVVRAWKDNEFKNKLLMEPTKTILEMGLIGFSGEHMVVLENTSNIHNIVVCTLCSCYPWAILGLPPKWYKSFQYRSRAVIEPKEVLKEFGITLDDEIEIKVWDSNADIRYLVLPQRPNGTEKLNEIELEKLVTRNSMIGTEILTYNAKK